MSPLCWNMVNWSVKFIEPWSVDSNFCDPPSFSFFPCFIIYWNRSGTPGKPLKMHCSVIRTVGAGWHLGVIAPAPPHMIWQISWPYSNRERTDYLHQIINHPHGFSDLPSPCHANVTYMTGSGLMGHELSRLCHSYFYHRQFFSINVDKLSRKEVNLVLQFMQLQLSKGLEPSCCKKRQKKSSARNWFGEQGTS